MKKLKLTRFASYIVKNESVAIYCYLDIIILKNETCQWFIDVVKGKTNTNVPQSFIDYLVRKKIIEYD